MKNKLLIGLLLTTQVSGALAKGQRLTRNALEEKKAILKEGSARMVHKTQNLVTELINDTIRGPKEELRAKIENFTALHDRLQARLKGLLSKAEKAEKALESTIENQYSTLQAAVDKTRANYTKYRNTAARAAALSDYKAAFAKFKDFKNANQLPF